MIKFGQSAINDIYFGNVNVNKVYFGSTLIFEKESSPELLYEFTKRMETLYNTIDDFVKSAFFYGNAEGGQSVKSPTLKMVGKNLFDGVIRGGIPGENIQDSIYKNTGYTEVEANKNYVIKADKVLDGIYFLNANKETISTQGARYDTERITTPDGCAYISVQFFNTTPTQVQIEEGTDPTTYEPHKSITLTTPSDLQLRSVGETRDVLNALTGQLIQRVGEDGNTLDQETIRTINMTMVDQDGNNVSTLKTFNDITHVIVTSNTSILPTVNIGVAFNSNSVQVISEDQNSISSTQANIEETINNQSQEIETAMIGITEIYEQQV